MSRYAVGTRPARPATVSVRPVGVEVNATASSPLSGTLVTVTPATAAVQPPPVPTLYKSTTGVTANPTGKSSTSSLVLTGNASKPTTILTPATATNTISIIGQPKTPAPSASANITLSVRGASNQSKYFKFWHFHNTIILILTLQR